jgi:protein transport protein SEC24
LFLIDVSRAAVLSGAFKASLLAVQEVFKSPDARQLYSHFALCTFDRSLHFYDLRGKQKQPQVTVLSDLSEPLFLPVAPDAIYFPTASCSQSLIDSLINRLTSLFSEQRTVESCLGTAVSIAVESLKETGGRVYVFASGLPSHGPGALRQRSETGVSVDKVNALLSPQGTFYSQLAQQAASNGISISMCLTPSAYIDVATLGLLVGQTGGSFTSVSRFTMDSHGEQIVQDTILSVTKPFVYDCVARVRCGEGLQAGAFYHGGCGPPPGHSTIASSSSPDTQFGSISCDQSFAVFLSYDGRLVDNETTGLQCAILHTTPTGQRRIRVINLALTSTKQVADVFKACDYEAIISVLTKQAIHSLPSSALSTVTNNLLSRTSQMLAAYRKAAASNVAATQLILPEELRLLPLFLLSALKSPAFSPVTATADARMIGLRALADLPNDLLSPFFYPRLYNLLQISTSNNSVPQLLRLSRDNLDRQGVFLLGT